MKKRNSDYIKDNKVIILVSLFLMIVIMLRATLISVPTKVEGINLKEFSESRTLTKEVLRAKRGTIYDRNGEILAIDVSAYTVIAYLEESRTENIENPKHVVDPLMTAESLSPVLGMEVETLYTLLTKEDVYQVELGPGGRGISELKKEEIEELNLPGIDFMTSYKRYYPKGIFASYLVGYAKNDPEGNIVGELGIEQQYEEDLSGENGYREYQRDRLGYQIPNTPYYEKEPQNGSDLYLTIDCNIQLFVEKAIKNNFEIYGGDWITMTVADAKTGEILASTVYPTYNPNERDIEIYLDPLVSYSYEPGSTMKIWTYMAIMENNMYEPDTTFDSGVMNFDTGERIRDWNNGDGWGTITFDEGFMVSSNVGVANLATRYISSADLKSYYKKLGFGEKTGIELPREYSGELNFKYLFDTATAAFGQGIKTTPIQNIQALTSISNDGELLKPYVIKEIVNNKKIVYEGKKTTIREVASQSTVDKIKDLMYEVVNGEDTSKITGSRYKIEGYDIIGKTGTAQIAKEDGTGYYSSSYGSIYSFAGMFPKDDPEVIIYTSVKRSVSGKTPIVNATKEVIRDIATYLNVYEEKEGTKDVVYTSMPSYLNRYINIVKNEITSNELVIIGNGERIVDQYPFYDDNISSKEKIFLLTNTDEIKMPNMKGWSYKDVANYFNIVDINFKPFGVGYVTNQSIKKGELITSDSIPEITFESEIIKETQ